MVKLFKELNDKLTPRFAHQLLAELPCCVDDIYYDIWLEKAFTMDQYGGVLAWSKCENKWIKWLHGKNPKSVVWPLRHIQEVAKLYKYNIGDRVLYCGLCNDDESCVYTVTGFDDQNRVMVSDGQSIFGGFYMDRWRLATEIESALNQRVFVGEIKFH